MNAARRAILVPFLATRVSLLLVGVLASRLMVSGLTLQRGNLVYHHPGPPFLDIWARWDAEWYLLIADLGYRAESHFLGLPVAYQPGDATGFFPLYPLLIRALAGLGLSSLLAGVLVSNLALLGALVLLAELVRRDLGDQAAARAAWILLAFPTSLFLSAVYAESLMLCCALGAILLARNDRPWLAGAAGALCVLSRPLGILILIPLFDELVVRACSPWRGQYRRVLARAAAALVVPASALVGYMLYCRAITGSLIPFIIRQERWRGATSGPWRALLRYFESPQLHGAHHSTIDLIIAVILVASIPLIFLRLRRSYALYATAAILLPLCSSLWSFSRFAACVFPFHMLLAAIAARHERWFTAYLAISLPLAGFFMALYASWWWVG